MELQNEVRERLEQLGYTIKNEDELCITFCINKVFEQIKNECNTSNVPNELKHTAIDIICGEFLYNKKNAGQTENFENLDFDAVVKSIQEGDTNITFAIGEGSLTPEKRIDKLIEFLLNNGRSQFVAHRRLKW